MYVTIVIFMDLVCSFVLFLLQKHLTLSTNRLFSLSSPQDIIIGLKHEWIYCNLYNIAPTVKLWLLLHTV